MARRKKFILVPMGSLGDVLPFVWLGRGLREAGHEVVAITHSPFLPHFSAAGIRAVTYGTAEDYQATVNHPDLWHPRRGFALIARVTEPYHRHVITLMPDEIEPGRTVLVGAALALGARILAEARRLPLVTIQLQPLAFLSVVDAPVLRAGWDWFPRSPRWVRRLLYRLGYWQTDWLLAENVNNLRAELGLSQPVKQVLKDYWLSPQRVLGLFPDWFAPKAADWPPQAVTTRFPLAESHPPGPSPPLEEFLREGEAPILFTPGSANAQAQRFFTVAREAARLLGTRALFITPFREQLPTQPQPGIAAFDHACFSWLFPRCRAVVHHGGIGTTAQAFAAGVPQIAMPLSHDQPDNASRLGRLGVGVSLPPRHFTPQAVADHLRHLLNSENVRAACRQVKERIQNQMPREQVVGLIDEIAPP